MTVVNLDILLSEVTRIGNRSVRYFDAERGVYLGRICLNTQVQPPQIEVELELPALGTQAFQFLDDGMAAIDHLIEDNLAMSLINKAIDQAIAPDFARFVKEELPPGCGAPVKEVASVRRPIVHNSWFDDVVDG